MKRIVICADGTWNIRDQIEKKTGKRRPTNVTKVARAVTSRSKSGIDQIVYYDEGVGTNGGLDRFTGGAFGKGIEDNVRDLYRFILYNHDPGDELYFFGFSRGAFTVRTLCGFMNRIGLIEKKDDYWIPDLYACYENAVGDASPEWQRVTSKLSTRQDCPPILFVGVWDTVGALGAPGLLGQLIHRGKYKYHNVGLTRWIENAYQALAIDERRKPFAPNLWTTPADWEGNLEQTWFAGVHSNIGGGYTPDGLANEALHWIVEKAEELGLEFNDAFLTFFEPCFNSTLHDSMTTMYRAMGEWQRPIGQHLAHGERVHQSAIDRHELPECRYAPSNLVNRPPGTPTSDTARVKRGKPCPDL